MRVIHSLTEADALSLHSPVAVTIGVFDGVHLGHQALLKAIQATGRTAAVVTFSNHPLTVLRPDIVPSLVCTAEHKAKLLEQYGTDLLVSLPFTAELAKQSPREFLTTLHNTLGFERLLLGYDAKLGSKGAGTPDVVRQLAPEIGFEVRYLEAVRVDDQIVSSTDIRGFVQSGDLLSASSRLGRPYSIAGPVVPGVQVGRAIGLPTLNLNTEGLCLPPMGVYVAQAVVDNQRYPAVANLGTAPTVKQASHPVLEVHLLDTTPESTPEYIEVILGPYLRKERRFADKTELKAQIQNDIERAKAHLATSDLYIK